MSNCVVLVKTGKYRLGASWIRRNQNNKCVRTEGNAERTVNYSQERREQAKPPRGLSAGHQGQTSYDGNNAGYDPQNYQEFAITNDGVMFFFSQGVLLPEAAGATQVLVPRSAIDPMLA